MDTRQQITDQILAMLETSKAGEWERPWAGAGLPVNATTDKHYAGINVIMLLIARHKHGFASNRWMTYKQAQGLGGQVRKGQKGTRIVFFRMLDIERDDGETDRIPMARSFTVFNEDQIDGLELEPMTAPIEQLDEAEALIAASGAQITHGGDQAFYCDSEDRIQVPARQAFKTMPGYYATVLHELVHWTGQASRCNRDMSSEQRSYAFEELVAELGTAMLCAKFGIGDATVEGHAQYIAHWIELLKDDKGAFMRAAAAAQRAIDWLEGVSTEQRQAA